MSLRRATKVRSASAVSYTRARRLTYPPSGTRRTESLQRSATSNDEDPRDKQGAHTMNRSPLLAWCAAGAFVLAACSNESPVTPPTPRTGVTAPSPSPMAAATPDPSVPSAASVPGAPAVASQTAKDSASTQPAGTLTKQEENNSMPMAAHGNNHSSPALETKSK